MLTDRENDILEDALRAFRQQIEDKWTDSPEGTETIVLGNLRSARGTR